MPSKKVSKKEALSSCGTKLKKGYRYVAGGGIVKVTVAAKKPTAKKPAASKRATTKGLGRTSGVRMVCVRPEPGGGNTTYNAFPSSSNPCPYGGTPMMPAAAGSLGRPATKRSARKKPAARKRK